MTKILLFLLFTQIIIGCMPQSGGGGAARQAASVGSSNTNNNPTGSYVNTVELYWFGNNTNTQTLNINSNNITNFYLRGKNVEAFLGYKNTLGILENFNSIYCMEVVFGGSLNTLRSRVVPIAYNDYASGKIERLFRVDIDNPVNSGTSCAGLPTPASVVFDVAQICPTCIASQLATSVKLYKSLGTVMGTQVPTSGASSLVTTSLLLRLDPTNNSNSNNGSCSASSCQAQGYDCCMSGQCILDGSIKPSALSDNQFLTIIKPSVDNQFSSFTSWPQYYNVCPRIPDPQVTPTPTATPDPGVVSAAQLNALKNDFYCTQELAATATSTPYNLFDFSSTTFPATACTGTEAQIESCLLGYRQNFATQGKICNATTTLNYLEVMKRVYQMCGCANTNWSLSFYDNNHPVNSCPYFSLKALSSLGIETAIDAQIANVQCTVGDPNPVVTPFENLTINVPAKSAPHRFFRSTNGVAVDDMGTISGSTVTPEGSEFSYLDPGTNSIPNNGSFNMNSILGQFDVSLTKAISAKVVNIEYDTTYVISAISGYYNPCPNCMRDSWFQTFSANPSSQHGIGTQAVGFSTSRDTFDGNTSGANYEDMIFGRACFVPPTMLPFSHKSYSTAQTQRMNRLTAQAAMYINGYQRDWYGFNKGAVIGSFDGVSWFAVGKNRRVRATSNKLFLAINAPFADLATPSTMVVSVRADEGIATAAEHDYDFGISPYDSRQNEAGSCQRYHLCENDTDCVTKLGWEYACADITATKTTWPKFDSNANELANTTQSFALSGILQGQTLTGSNNKRCVYRGAGAPCSTNYSLVGTGGSNDQNIRKLLSCAPNFYCADKGASTFNTEIARFATALEEIPLSSNHFYGREANIIGRPLHYMGATASLPSAAKDALVTNANLWGLTNFNSNIGLCVPGRQLTSTTTVNLANTQKAKDASNRTDYINQIAGCDSNAYYSNGRYANCPVLDPVASSGGTITGGNYRQFASYGATQSFSDSAPMTQNTCGKESQNSSGVSPFFYIEAGTLSGSSIVDKTLTKDACLRRPGAVCHTDLDCSPNKLHAEQVDNFDVTYYGNTTAEQSYWRESLVCGQAAPKPAVGTTAYNQYDMTQNRCCREVGKDLTLFTQSSLTGSLNTAITPLTAGYTTNWNKTNGRYSRYLTVPGFPSSQFPAPNVSTTSALFTPRQWKTIGLSAKNTCCGGTWIRKFSDGSHTWPIGSRNNYNVSDFSCLNYRYEAPVQKPAQVHLNAYEMSYGQLCNDPNNQNGGCAQTPFAQNSSTSIIHPTNDNPLSGWNIMETSGPWGPGGWSYDFYRPHLPLAASGVNGKLFIDQYAGGAEFYLPAYIDGDINIGLVQLGGGLLSGNNHLGYNMKFNANWTNIQNAGPNSVGTCLRKKNGWYYAPSDNSYTTALGNICGFGSGYGLKCGCYWEVNNGIMSVSMAPTDFGSWQAYGVYLNPSSGGVSRVSTTGAGAFVKHDLPSSTPYRPGIQIAFNLPGSIYHVDTVSTTPPYTLVSRGSQNKHSVKQGNDLSYLVKLGRMELSGIPQVVHEPVFCSMDRSQLVPGLYAGNILTRNDFNSNSTTFSPNPAAYLNSLLGEKTLYSETFNDLVLNPTQRVVRTDKLKNQIFSSDDFICCLPLGSSTSAPGKCCSGFEAEGICKLPAKTDLNVYFNRFVSNEGRDPAGPAGGLVDTDFDQYSGEPLLETNTKLFALGDAYCPDGVRQGGAFGEYKIQPAPPSGVSPNTRYSIVDTYSDLDTENDDERGAAAFNDGFRWNHHLYCK